MNISKIKPMAMMAEFFATFALSLSVLISLSGFISGNSTAQVAGLVLAVMFLIVGSVSGAHLNPAVTFGAWRLKRLDLTNACAEWLAQFSGAMLAWVVLSLFMTSEPAQFATAGNSWEIFGAETLGAFVFGLGITVTAHRKYDGLTAAGLLGFSLFLGISWAGVASNGIINPAVAAATGSLSWSYLLAPMLGIFLGGKFYLFFLTKDHKL